MLRAVRFGRVSGDPGDDGDPADPGQKAGQKPSQKLLGASFGP